MRYFAILIILLTPIVVSIGAAGETYKWTDKEGNPHFSDTPPPYGEVVYETLSEARSSSGKESADPSGKARYPSSSLALYSGKPLYFWRDQFEMLNSKITMKQKDIRLLKSAIDKTDMYQPEKKSGMIIYPRELRVDGKLLNTRSQFIEEWARQSEQLRDLEEELQTLRHEAQLAGIPRWVWEN